MQPWDIAFVNLIFIFSTSSYDKVTLTYDFGKNHAHEHFLLQRDCETNITDIMVSTNVTVSNVNDTYSSLVVSHDFDKTALGRSVIWNSTSSNIEICQIVNLYVPATSMNAKMVVQQDVQQINLGIDGSADFSIGSNLTGREVSLANVNTTVSILAYKCTPDFVENNQTLKPGTELHMCIESGDPDIWVEKIASMVRN